MGKGKSNASQSIEDRKPMTISLSEWYKTEKSNVWQFIEYKGSKSTYQSMGKLVVSSLSLRKLQSFNPEKADEIKELEIYNIHKDKRDTLSLVMPLYQQILSTTRPATLYGNPGPAEAWDKISHMVQGQKKRLAEEIMICGRSITVDTKKLEGMELLMSIDPDEYITTDEGSEKLIQFLEQTTQLVSLKLTSIISNNNLQAICKALKNYTKLQTLEITGFGEEVSGSAFKNLASVKCNELILEDCLTEEIIENVFSPGNSFTAKSLWIMVNVNHPSATLAEVKKLAPSFKSNIKGLKFIIYGITKDNAPTVVDLFDVLNTNKNLTSLCIESPYYMESDSPILVILKGFLLQNESLKELTLSCPGKETTALIGILKTHITLHTLIIGKNSYINWIDAIKESRLKKIVFMDNYPSKGGLEGLVECVEANPTIEDIIFNNLSALSNDFLKSTDILDKSVPEKTDLKAALELNIVVNTTKLANKMLEFNAQLSSSSQNKISIQNVDISKNIPHTEGVKIAFLYAIEKCNHNILGSFLGENAWLIDAFLNNYKNNNGLILTFVCKGNAIFPKEIWAHIFSYLTAENMYDIVYTKTPSKIEEIAEDILPSGEVNFENHDA